MCDLIVDRLGWSFVVCNVCNMGTFGQRSEQQLVFRYDGEREEIPPSRTTENSMLDKAQFENFIFPNYWPVPCLLPSVPTSCSTPPHGGSLTPDQVMMSRMLRSSPEVLGLEQAFSIVPCENAELTAIQKILHTSFTRLPGKGILAYSQTCSRLAGPSSQQQQSHQLACQSHHLVAS
eukprot:1248026-Amphidinium_carterae.1